MLMEHWVEGMGGSSDWDEQSGGGESMLGGQGRESHLLIRSAGGVIIILIDNDAFLRWADARLITMV